MNIEIRSVAEAVRIPKEIIPRYVYNSEVAVTIRGNYLDEGKGKHYIVAKNLPTREQAMEIAETYVAQLTTNIDKEIKDLLGQFPEAKE